MLRTILDFFPSLDEKLLERKRFHMLSQMIWETESGLEKVDYDFGHDLFWVPPEKEDRVIDGRGYVGLHVKPKFHGKENLHYWLSVWQIGDQLKIAVILKGETAQAPILEGQNEIETMFPDAKTELHDRDGEPMYQWTWHVPNLYDSWLAREKYVRNFRHLYYRMCRIVHDGTI